MKKIIETYSKRPENLFKTFYVTFLFAGIPFALLHIFFNIFGIIPVNFNNEKIYGVKAVVVIILFTPVMALMIAFFTWIFFMIGNFFLRVLNTLIK